MKIHITGYEESKQGRHRLYNGWDKKEELYDVPLNQLGDKLNEIYDKDFGDVQYVEIKVRHKLNVDLEEQDKRYVKAVGVELENRLLISFAQFFVISIFLTLYLALTGTVENYHNIIHGDSYLEIFLLFFVNAVVMGVFFSFGISNLIFLIRSLIFSYKEKRRNKK